LQRPELQIIGSAALPYLLSLPPEAPGRRPVLCFLHGLDEGAPTDMLVGLTRHGPLRPESSLRATPEFIVLAPQLPDRGDHWRLHARAVVEIVRQGQSHYQGDPRRTYLTGFSYGGNGVFDLALHERSLWAALWSVDPTRAPAQNPGLPVWLSSGQVSRFGGRRFMARLKLQPPGTPGGEDRVYLDEGFDHVGTATSAYQDDRIYAWLLTKTA
jgi:poly(3-hydroxybutyrate) depolymerase